MGTKSSPELPLCFLLMSVLCFEAFIPEKKIYLQTGTLTWTEARLYCQKNYIDMVTWQTVNRLTLAKWMSVNEIQQIWIGLTRDPKNDSGVWKWIDLKTGKGTSGEDASPYINWTSGLNCALVSGKDLMYSKRCSKDENFYCSIGDTIQYQESGLSWPRARQFCKSLNGDLATITKNNSDKLKKKSWIGLYQEPGGTWSWIGNLSSEYRNWAPGQPPNCVSFNSATLTCQSKACSEKLQFACLGDDLVLVNENKTWEEALSHCLDMATQCSDDSESCNHHYNLLSLQSLSSYNYVRARIYRATTDEVWTGLRFLGGEWWWVNGEKLEDQGLLPKCPAQWKHCGTLSKYDTDNWISRDCSEKRNFICHRH